MWQAETYLSALSIFYERKLEKNWSSVVDYLYMLNLFVFEVAILKIMYNMVSSNINLTLKVTGTMILPSA